MNTSSIDKRANRRAEGYRFLSSRRSLLRNFGIGAAAVGVAAATDLHATPAEADAALDIELFNFALNLEYLESNFYLLAVSGQGLHTADTTGTGTPGAIIGGSKVPFQQAIIAQYANNLAALEQGHTRFVRAAINAQSPGAQIAQPEINYQMGFTSFALAAGLITSGQTFNPFGDEISFLLATVLFEDIGASAYAGAARYISNPDNLEAAAGLLAIEGYNASTARTLLASIGAGEAVRKISNLRAFLSGSEDDQGILMANGNVNVAPADSNALLFRRSPREVLNIAYGMQNASSGGFFPNGFNGALS